MPGSQSTSRAISYRARLVSTKPRIHDNSTVGKLVRLQDQKLLLPFFSKGRPTPRKPADRDEIRELYILIVSAKPASTRTLTEERRSF